MIRLADRRVPVLTTSWRRPVGRLPGRVRRGRQIRCLSMDAPEGATAPCAGRVCARRTARALFGNIGWRVACGVDGRADAEGERMLETQPRVDEGTAPGSWRVQVPGLRTVGSMQPPPARSAGPGIRPWAHGACAARPRCAARTYWQLLYQCCGGLLHTVRHRRRTRWSGRRMRCRSRGRSRWRAAGARRHGPLAQGTPRTPLPAAAGARH